MVMDDLHNAQREELDHQYLGEDDVRLLAGVKNDVKIHETIEGMGDDPKTINAFVDTKRAGIKAQADDFRTKADQALNEKSKTK